MNKKLFMSLAIFSSTFVASELANLNEAEASTKKPATYKLTGNVATYTNAANAKTGVNATKKTYTAGNYYIYKTASNGMINISTQAGKPGAWINPVGQVKAQVPAQNTPAKSTTPKTSSTVAKQTASKPVASQSGNTYVLNSTAKTYVNAANAAAGVNAKSTYSAGKYFVYRTANNGMLNISRTAGKVGAWINPKDNKAVVKQEPKQTTQAPTTSKPVTKETQKPTTSTAKKPETYVLTTSVRTYTNAANAAAGKNSKSTYAKGTYYVFRSANGMLNISKTAGKVGAWINPSENKVTTKQETVANTESSKTVTQNKATKPVEKQKSGVRTDYGNYSKIIYLDAGHGAGDSGAAYFGQKEKDLNLSIYKKLTTQLQKQGYTIVGTRNSDTFTKLQDISAKANNTNADLFVSIHFNASSSSSAKGIETYWYQDYAEYPTKINKDNHTNPDRLRRSQVLANGIHSNLVKNTGAVDRGVRRDTYSVLRETAIPAVLLELGYMSNREEATKIGQSSYQDKLVDGIVKGINNYYEKA